MPDIRGALGVGVGEAWRGCSAGLSGCAVMRAGLGRSLLSGVADIGMSPGAAVEVPEWREGHEVGEEVAERAGYSLDTQTRHIGRYVSDQHTPSVHHSLQGVG